MGLSKISYFWTKNPREEIINFKNADIFGLKEMKEIAQHEKEAFKSAEKVSNKKITIPRSGKTGLLSIVPILDKKNKAAEIVCSIKDISDISMAHEKQELLLNIINKLEVGVWIDAVEPLKHIFISEAFKKISGIDDLSKKTSGPGFWNDQILPEDRYKIKVDKNFDFSKPVIRRFRINHGDGTIHHLEAKAYRTKNKNNKEILFGVTRDITDEYKKNKRQLELEKQ
jgi:PAS domain-containing protein